MTQTVERKPKLDIIWKKIPEDFILPDAPGIDPLE